MQVEQVIQAGSAYIKLGLIKGPIEMPDFTKDNQLTLRDAMSVARAWSDRDINKPETALKACLAAIPFHVVLCDDVMMGCFGTAPRSMQFNTCANPPDTICVTIHLS